MTTRAIARSAFPVVLIVPGPVLWAHDMRPDERRTSCSVGAHSVRPRRESFPGFFPPVPFGGLWPDGGLWLTGGMAAVVSGHYEVSGHYGSTATTGQRALRIYWIIPSLIWNMYFNRPEGTPK